MKRQVLGLAAVLSLVGGLIGGFVSGLSVRGEASAGEAEQATKLVTTQELRIVDPAGRTRARLGTDAKGAVAFYLFDQDGKERARLGVFDDLTAIALTGKKEEKSSGLSVFDDGRAELTLHTDAKVVHLPAAPPRHWVLWGQRMPFEVPIGTWASQAQCEEQRLQRQQTLTSWILTCLPEGVELRRQ